MWSLLGYQKVTCLLSGKPLSHTRVCVRAWTVWSGWRCLPFQAGQALGRVSRRDRLPHVAAGQKLVLMFPFQYGFKLFYGNKTALIESELSVSYGHLKITVDNYVVACNQLSISTNYSHKNCMVIEWNLK